MDVTFFPVLGAFVRVVPCVARVRNKSIPSALPVCLVPDPLQNLPTTVRELTVCSHEIALVKSSPGTITLKRCDVRPRLKVSQIVHTMRPYIFDTAYLTNIHPYLFQSFNILA